LLHGVLWWLGAVIFLCFRPSTAVLLFSGAVTLFYTHYLGAPPTLPSGDGARAAR
jgi:hypothetical protein